MGFYGNITNTSKTQFQFDRIYSSRSAMENKMYTDNIYRTDLQGTIICEMDGNGNYRFFSEKEQ